MLLGKDQRDAGGEPPRPFLSLPFCKQPAQRGSAVWAVSYTHLNAWFTGFLQSEENPLAFIVLVENGGSGSQVAGKVAKQVLAAAVGR